MEKTECWVFLPFNPLQLAFQRERGQMRMKDKRLLRGNIGWKRLETSWHKSSISIFCIRILVKFLPGFQPFI